jgi:hypothetical protein
VLQPFALEIRRHQQLSGTDHRFRLYTRYPIHPWSAGEGYVFVSTLAEISRSVSDLIDKFLILELYLFFSDNNVIQPCHVNPLNKQTT